MGIVGFLDPAVFLVPAVLFVAVLTPAVVTASSGMIVVTKTVNPRAGLFVGRPYLWSTGSPPEHGVVIKKYMGTVGFLDPAVFLAPAVLYVAVLSPAVVTVPAAWSS